MKKVFTFLLMLGTALVFAQKPCEQNPKYNEFDFWIGEWEVYAKNGNLAGKSKISKILDNCVVLEEWTSVAPQKGLTFTGKSYNTYNASSGQWQQTWVDNTGGTTEFLIGKFENNSIQFVSRPFNNNKQISIRRLTFYKLDNGNVRQHGEISTDDGKTFNNEYDLEYRKKITTIENEIQMILTSMESEYNKGNFETIANFYSKNGKVIGKNTGISGKENLRKYWKSFEIYAGTWKLTNLDIEKVGDVIWQKGISEIKDLQNRIHKVNFTLIFIKEDNQWKILQDCYW